MSKYLKALFSVFTFVAILFVIFFIVFNEKWHAQYKAPVHKNRPSETLMTVPPGASLAHVTDSLIENNLISSRRLFLIGTRIAQHQSDIKAGTYAIPYGASAAEILEIIISGNSVPIKVTIPEGSSAIEVADIVSKNFHFTAKQFLSKADSIVVYNLQQNDCLFPSSYQRVIEDESLSQTRRFYICEGYLFPETYHFSEGTSAANVAEALVELCLDRLFQITDQPLSDDTDLSFHQIVTLASIVEAETIYDSEKPKVAAVYLNRLNTNHKLEADPTIAFFLSKKGQRIYYKDLAKQSAFNTYLNQGLPPGPINNPGFKAILSVFQPQPDFSAFFFVADGSGKHVFSNTLKDHNIAVKKYRELRNGS